jgi:hypothetical protein
MERDPPSITIAGRGSGCRRHEQHVPELVDGGADVDHDRYVAVRSSNAPHVSQARSGEREAEVALDYAR